MARRVDPSYPAVAKVCVDTPFSWPDKLYDYVVAPDDSDRAVPGTPVRVTFAGKRRNGFIVARSETTTSDKLGSIEKIHAPATSVEIVELAQRLAREHVAPLWDVLRSAIPPRHARAEKAAAGAKVVDAGENPLEPGDRYAMGVGEDDIAGLVAQVVRADHSALIVAPTNLDVARLRAAVERALPGEPIAELTSGQSAELRYRTQLAILHGRTKIVIGTRSAAFAPLAHIGLIVTVDEGNGAMRDKRSPYLWADTVLRMRARNACFYHVGVPRVAVPVDVVKGNAWPKVSTPDQWPGDQRGLLPQAAFEVIRTGLESGPVLVSAPRPGYVPALSCASCGGLATCPQCHTPIMVPGPGQEASCRTCGDTQWRCECGSTRLRARQRGTERLAHELAAAFPGGIDLLRSGTEPSNSRLVIATPGAEPNREFSAGVILDAGMTPWSMRLDGQMSALGRWWRVARLVRDHLLICSEMSLLTRGFAQRDLSFLEASAQDRRELGQPPFHTWLKVSGPKPDMIALLGRIGLALDGQEPPRQSIQELLTGGGVQAFASGLYMVGPVADGEGLMVYLHEQAPGARLVGALHEALSSRARIRVESEPIL